MWGITSGILQVELQHERLEALKRKVVSFTRDDLVDKRIGFLSRLKSAETMLT